MQVWALGGMPLTGTHSCTNGPIRDPGTRQIHFVSATGATLERLITRQLAREKTHFIEEFIRVLSSLQALVGLSLALFLHGHCWLYVLPSQQGPLAPGARESLRPERK